MYTFKIINVETVFYQASNVNVIEVEAEIFKEIPVEKPGDDNYELVGNKKFAYDLGTTKETILAELEKVCATLGSDEAVANESAALEASLAEVESLKAELLPAKDEEVTA